RRIHLLPFSITIPPEERNKSLADQLRQEWPGILVWMIDGCLAWQERGSLDPPECVRLATDEYFADQDLIGQWLAEECDSEPGNIYKSETVAELFGSFSAYARRHGDQPGSKNDFSDGLNARGFDRH